MIRSIDKHMLDVLLRTIEEHVKFCPNSPRDFKQLSKNILKVSNERLSDSTLKRLWGYEQSNHTPYFNTLNILSRYLGYTDFEDFYVSNESKETNDNPSFLVTGTTITTESLNSGQQLSLQWKPDRACLLQYKSNYLFEVIYVKNAKLSVGDTFRCQLFVNGQSLTVYDLTHEGQSGLTYTCGQGDGGILAKLV